MASHNTTEEQQRRIEQLITELDRFGDQGYIHMPSWVRLGEATLEEARANPCGTAACICGKAGLMQVFREEGFYWDPARSRNAKEFPISPATFFGREVNDAVFCGWWCKNHIHTPAQAVIVLRAFLVGLDEGQYMHVYWQPPAYTMTAIRDLEPMEKVFPVSRMRRTREYGYWDWASFTIKGEDCRVIKDGLNPETTV